MAQSHILPDESGYRDIAPLLVFPSRGKASLRYMIGMNEECGVEMLGRQDPQHLFSHLLIG